VSPSGETCGLETGQNPLHARIVAEATETNPMHQHAYVRGHEGHEVNHETWQRKDQIRPWYAYRAGADAFVQSCEHTVRKRRNCGAEYLIEKSALHAPEIR